MNSIQKPSIRKFFTFVLLLVLSIIATNFIIGTSLFISAKIAWGLAALSSVLLSLVLIVFSFYLKKWVFSWAALIAVIASILGGMYIGDYVDLQGREIIRNIEIKALVINYRFVGIFRSDLFARDQK